MDTGNQKLKVSMDLDEARDDLNYDPNSIGLAGLDSVQILQISLDGNGNKLFTFLCDDSEMDDYLFGIYQQLDLIGEDIRIKEMKGSFLISQECFCTAQTMDIVMDIPVGNTTVAADVKIEIVYENPGQPVEFVLPSTEEYTEV